MAKIEVNIPDTLLITHQLSGREHDLSDRWREAIFTCGDKIVDCVDKWRTTYKDVACIKAAATVFQATDGIFLIRF